MENVKFQIFKNFNQPQKACTEPQILEGLKGLKMKGKIEPIRKLMERGEKEAADKLKKLLPALTISGTFSGGRKPENLVEYSHVICLDLDKVPVGDLNRLKEIAINQKFTRMAFISPGGSGLKILVGVDSGLNYHKDAFKQVVKYYTSKMDVTFDECTSDITRLTFMSYDPEPYYDTDSEIFSVSTPLQPNAPTIQKDVLMPGGSTYQSIYQTALELTKRKYEYMTGNRNHFVYNLANNCNRYGLPLLALEHMLDWCDLPEGELTSLLNNVYKNQDQFGLWTMPLLASKNISKDLSGDNIHMGGSQTDENESDPSVFEDSPLLPAEVFELIPDFLKDVTDNFDDGTEKDLVLLSCLGVLSSAFPNVRGVYARSAKALNLFQLFVAPPSSGKGQMKWAEFLGRGIDKYLQEKYKSEYETYVAKGEDPNAEEPVEKSFFIATDSSNIALANQMRANVNIGVMYDSEGSTLATMFKNDWSNSLNILLKSFENESVAINRKMRADCFSIEKTFLSLVLSTTPSQLVKIIGDIDSGLYSRFLIYYFRSPVVWKDFFSSESDCLEPIFEQASQRLLEMYIANEKNPITTIGLTEKQRLETFNFFEQRQKEFHSEYDHHLIANVRRTCVMYYKIAMILTTLRAYESGEILPERLVIDDRDHKAAMLIVETLLQHVKIVYDNTQPEQFAIPIGKKKTLFNGLPSQAFAKNEYLSISNELGIKKPTAEKWLKDLQHTGKLVKLDHGQYQKVA